MLSLTNTGALSNEITHNTQFSLKEERETERKDIS